MWHRKHRVNVWEIFFLSVSIGEADFTASCVLHHGVPSSKDHRRQTLNGRRGRNESVSATGRNSFCAEKKIPSRPKLWNKDKVSGGK